MSNRASDKMKFSNNANEVCVYMVNESHKKTCFNLWLNYAGIITMVNTNLRKGSFLYRPAENEGIAGLPLHLQ